MWHQLLLGGEHFSVLAPSRFGYVGTQLEAGHHGSRAELTLSQQAEAINDLLHALDLNKVTLQIALGQAKLIAYDSIVVTRSAWSASGEAVRWRWSW